jgi:hypothetical protein
LTVALISCSGPAGDPASEGAAVDGYTVTEAEYIDFIAALTVALEEGLTGEAIDLRVSELGVKVLNDDDIEPVLDDLRRDPIHWVEIERSVGERIELIRKENRRPKRSEHPESER